jgi:peptidyl-prolyl cis-trans isomerase D
VLDVMRKGADSFVLKVLFVIIVLVFVFWGVGTMRSNRMQVAARVNGEVITNREFQRAYENLSKAYRNASPQAMPAEFLRGQALSALITTELLNQEAERLGLMVDADELRQSIAGIKTFQVDGRFNKENYVEILRQNSLKPADFESLQRRQLLASKVQELVQSAVHVSDQALHDRFRYENERINLRFVRIPAANFSSGITLTDDEVQAYFKANQEHYREPERVRISLVDFRPQSFADQVTPTDEEIQAYYDAHQEDYHRPEEVHARHILFKLAANASAADKAAARAQAEEVLAKAKGGADFAELAKQYSQDSTASAGGDLGFFGHGVMTPAFETAAFALQPGQISDIVESPFGLHIIKVEEKHPERQAPLDEVRGEIVTAIKNQQARTVALKKVEDAQDRLLDGADLKQVAADAGLTVQTPPPFARTEPVGTLGPRPELVKQAFNTDAGQPGDIVTEGDGYTIFTVDEVIPSAIPDLAAVRPRVEADLRAQKASAEAKAQGEKLLGELKATPDLDALAQREGLKVEQSDQIGRFGTYLPNLGNVPDLKDAAFKLTKESPLAPQVYEANGDAIVAVLAARLPADESKFASEKDQLRQREQQRAQAAVMQTFLDELKAKAQVEYGEGFKPGPALPGAPS